MKTLLTMILLGCASMGCGGDDTDTGPGTAGATTTGATTGGADAAPPKACETNVTGRITVQNTGTQIITILLNGIGAGEVNTGASLDVDLPPGPYTLEINHLDGSVACTTSTINISECSSQHVSCAG